jgi:hypothetical protein
MWWTKKRMDHAARRFTELIREMTLLWMVFAILDRLVVERLSISWVAFNLAAGVAGWAIAVYIELWLVEK